LASKLEIRLTFRMLYGNIYKTEKQRNFMAVITIWRWLQFATETYRISKNQFNNYLGI